MKHARWFYLSTAAIMMAGSMPAVAQQAAAAGAAAPAAATDPDGGLEDIVVTAERRSESLQRVPIAITAITARALERSGTTGVNSLAQVTPGLNFTAPAGQLSPFLRGVGTAAAAVGNPASVATYVDGVYIPGMASTQFEFNNIERIEVLKGPQGTLFGRNSTGGIINVITKDPTFEPQLRMRAGYGNYDTVEGSIYGSAGLTKDIALDLSAFYRNQAKGWSYNFATKDDVAKQRDFLIRSKLLFTPGPDTRMVLALDYSYTNPAAASLNKPYQDALTVVGIPVPGGFWDVNQNFYERGVAKQGGGSLTVEQGMGAVRLRSITAYRKQYGHNIIDLDGSPVPAIAIDITERSKQFTQELQLLSDGSGPFTWILGGFYLNGTAQTDPFQNPVFKLFATQQVESGSAFAQGTYEVAEGTRLTAGLRYTNDSYTFNDYRQSNATGAITLDPQRTTSQGKLTWRLSADHQFTRDVLGYVSYNRGFRAGTFNLTDASVAALRPEVIDALEAGLKTDLLDRRLRVNVAVFHYDFKDIQIARADGNSQQTLNASSAEIWGVDGDISAAITSQLTLNVSGSYVHGRYGSFLNAPISTRNPRGGNTIITGDATGNTIIRTPDFSGNAGVNYVIPSSVGKFNVSANYYYNAGWYSDPDNRIKTPSYNLVSGSLGWTSSDDRYEARLWAKNLTNAKYYYHVQSIGPGDVAIPAAPRTYGVTLGVNF
ncbi:MAG TPA: TonB-dependent receptor [Sphingomonas sp.]|jgi:iron complex outermembrane receptor protein|uniref:TonB-dependent receptor n=1 Tax=Sphingomonas sp. TaxID=28214 RepID=UPI002ED8DB95